MLKNFVKTKLTYIIIENFYLKIAAKDVWNIIFVLKKHTSTVKGFNMLKIYLINVLKYSMIKVLFLQIELKNFWNILVRYKKNSYISQKA